MKKRLYAIAFMFFVMILSSCSNKPQDTIVETIYEKQYIPLDLLRVSCKEQPAGETVRSLASSWSNNTSCLRAHQILIEGLIKTHTKQGVTTNEQPK